MLCTQGFPDNAIIHQPGWLSLIFLPKKMEILSCDWEKRSNFPDIKKDGIGFMGASKNSDFFIPAETPILTPLKGEETIAPSPASGRGLR
ncbi:MAG TPA: hypothetical protein VFQ99_06540 [Gallionella sp.]|nr:hypothetical protein [Gallionella sp.]